MYRIWLKSEQDYERDIDGDVMTFATEREALDLIPHSAARHDISKFDMEVVEDGEVRLWTTKRKLRETQDRRLHLCRLRNLPAGPAREFRAHSR